jgi:hypothetical protein
MLLPGLQKLLTAIDANEAFARAITDAFDGFLLRVKSWRDAR